MRRLRKRGDSSGWSKTSGEQTGEATFRQNHAKADDAKSWVYSHDYYSCDHDRQTAAFMLAMHHATILPPYSDTHEAWNIRVRQQDHRHGGDKAPSA
jgi:hypothetical protein